MVMSPFFPAAIFLVASTVGLIAADQGKPRESVFMKTLRDTLNIDAVRREFVYQKLPNEELELDIYYPREAPPANGYPVIIWFHGGGWILGSKRQDVFVRHFPRYGYAVASVEYRLAQGDPFPAQIRDARTAAWWLWKNARALDLDPQAMVVAGQSAGGHLALLLAGPQGENRKGWGPSVPRGTLKAVAAMYPPTDLLRLVPPSARDNPLHPVALLLGGKVNEHMALAREASPLFQAKAGDPPTFLLHGESDKVVPVEQSVLLAKKLKSLSVPTRLTLTDGGHAFTLYPDQVDDLLNFFDSVPALKGRSKRQP